MTEEKEPINNTDLEEKDELQVALDNLSAVLKRKGLVHISLTALEDDQGARLLVNFPRWFAVQSSSQGFAAIPRGFKEGLDAVRTVNVGFRFLRLLGQVSRQVGMCLEHVVENHKVIITKTAGPENGIILPTGVSVSKKDKH